MEMVVCSGVAIRLCRDKAWKITIHLRQGYGGQASNAPFSDRNKSFQAFLKTFEIASKERKNHLEAHKTSMFPLRL